MFQIRLEYFILLILLYLGFGIVMGFAIANTKNWQPTIEHHELMKKCRVNPSEWDCQVYLKTK